MEIIPAIDLMGGKVVRLTRGDPSTVKVYENFGDPLKVAESWEKDGADAIHVVDLDAALDKGSNLELVKKIAQVVSVPVQVGGGIRSLRLAEDLLKTGIDRIIVGSLAFEKTQALKRLAKNFGSERVVIALDHRRGEVMVHGWRTGKGLGVDEAIQSFLSLGFKLFLITSIEKDGTLAGLDYDTLSGACSCPGIHVIAAGGVSSLEDLMSLKRIGVWAVVIGKALYEGVFNLREAVKIAREG